MLTHIPAIQWIGSKRELKKPANNSGQAKSVKKNYSLMYQLRLERWKIQQEMALTLFQGNDFSFYDHVLDLSLTLGVIPQRHRFYGWKV